MLTRRDKQIVKFIEEYNSVSIEMIRKIFFKQQNSGYEIARRRLGKMVDDNIVKCSRNISTNENIYYLDKKLSYHDLIVNNFYAELVYYGCKNIKYERKKEWLNRDIISDAYCSYELGDYVYYNLIEVCRTHFEIPIEKYERLYDTGLLQRVCNGTFPRIILVDDVEHIAPKVQSDKINIIQVNYNFDNFNEIFL